MIQQHGQTGGGPVLYASLDDCLVSGTEPTNVRKGDLWLDTSEPAPAALPGNYTYAVDTVTGTVTLISTQEVILADATTAAFTITLPASSEGLMYWIKKIDSSANAVTIDGDGSETIDGDTTKILSSQYDAVQLLADGTEWWIL